MVLYSLLTDAELAVGDGRCSRVSVEVDVVVSAAADGVDEVVAVGVAGKAPVLGVAGTSGPLEGEREQARVVAERRVHDVVLPVSHWLRAPSARPTTDREIC